MRTSDRTVEFVTTLIAMTAIAFCAVFLRIFCKLKYRFVILDDHLVVVAWIFTLASLCCFLDSVFSFGYTLKMEDRHHFPEGAATIVAIGQALTSASGATAKASIALTLWKVTPIYWQQYVLKVITAITISATIITGVVISIKIHDNKMDEECAADSPIWRFGVFVSVWGVFSDFILSGFPWIIMWNLQKKKAEKYGLCVAMSLGFVTGILGIMKLSYINCVSVLDAEVSYTSVDLVIYHFVEPTVIITAACLPALCLGLKEEVRNRRSTRASELLHFANQGPGGSARSRPDYSFARGAGDGAGDGDLSFEEVLRGPPRLARPAAPLPAPRIGRGLPVGRAAVGSRGPRGPLGGPRPVTTVTTITGGHRMPSDGSTINLPGEGQIFRITQVKIVSSESRE